MPRVAKRKDLGRKELKGIKIDKEDKPVVKVIEKKKVSLKEIDDRLMTIDDFLK